MGSNGDVQVLFPHASSKRSLNSNGGQSVMMPHLTAMDTPVSHYSQVRVQLKTIL